MCIYICVCVETRNYYCIIFCVYFNVIVEILRIIATNIKAYSQRGGNKMQIFTTAEDAVSVRHHAVFLWSIRPSKAAAMAATTAL